MLGRENKLAGKMAEKKDDLRLLRYLDALVEDLRKLVPRATKDREIKAVHDARVATRRLTAAMELLESVLSGKARKPFEKVLRLLRRRLSAQRDLDVMLEHLAKMKLPPRQAQGNALGPAVQWMIGRFEKARVKSAEKAAADLPGAKVSSKLAAWWGVRQEIVAAIEVGGTNLVQSLLVESIHLQLDEFAEAAAQIGVEGTDPHQLRIAGKSLRYTLEMAREQGSLSSRGASSRPVLAAFKRIQTALGLWHDYVVLTERILCESAEQQLAHHDPAKQQALLKLAALMLRRGQHQLGKVSDFWRGDGPALIERIRSAFPLTRPVVEVVQTAQEQPMSHEEQGATALTEGEGHEKEKLSQ